VWCCSLSAQLTLSTGKSMLSAVVPAGVEIRMSMNLYACAVWWMVWGRMVWCCVVSSVSYDVLVYCIVWWVWCCVVGSVSYVW
jgi:hypothetical protein